MERSERGEAVEALRRDLDALHGRADAIFAESQDAWARYALLHLAEARRFLDPGGPYVRDSVGQDEHSPAAEPA